MNYKPKNLPDNFCFSPWNEIHSQSGGIGPCCVNFNVTSGSFVDYLTSQELIDIKKSFLAGEKHPSCRVCWETENAGIISIRQNNLDFSRSLSRISIALSNKCNFKCITCNPNDSSAWSNDQSACEIREMNPVIHRGTQENLDWIIDQCKQRKICLTLLGGEPLINPDYLYLLNKIEEYDLYDNVFLVVTTNLSKLSYKGFDHLEHWSRFKQLDVFASFDGVGSVGEYIRSGKVFSRFEENLDLANKFVTHFSTTISLYNVFHMPKIFEYAEEKNKKISFCFLVDPDWLSIQNLTKADRNILMDYYVSEGFYNKDIFNFLETDKYLNKKAKFIQYTKDLDLLWDRDILTSIPELRAIM